MAQTTTSIGLRQGKDTETPRSLPPSTKTWFFYWLEELGHSPLRASHGRALVQAAQSTEHGPLSTAHTMEASGRAQCTMASVPQCHQSRSLAHNLCSRGLCLRPWGKPCSSSASGPMVLSDSQPASSSPRSASLRRSSHSHSETKGSSCFSSTLLLWVPGQELEQLLTHLH